MKNNLICFFSALRFLTIVPAPWFRLSDDWVFTECVKYFTVIGFLIGCGGYALSLLIAPFFPPALHACLLLLYLAGISGFLHLDGLADTADGFFSARPKKLILEIMHDSRTGAMGVVALIVILLFKFSALFSIPSENLRQTVFILPIAGRCAIVLSMVILPYAREEAGLGKLFYLDNYWPTFFITIIILITAGYFVGINIGVVAILALLLTTSLFGVWCKRIIGGTTGDTLGAVCELTETVTAMGFAVYFNL